MAESTKQRLKALIVDDDSLICDYIKLYTDTYEFESVTLSQPEQFESVYDPAFDLIVLDLNMPCVDGIELIRYLGEKESSAEVVLISAEEKSVLVAAQNLATNHNLSVLGILDKPIIPEELEKLILSCRESRRLAQNALASVKTLSVAGTRELPSLEDLRNAIDNNDIDVHFQPKIDLTTGRVSGVEALARWNHPEKGFIPPDFFIAFAEKYSLIEEITTKILEKTCDHILSWEGFPNSCQISVNISEISLGDLQFPDVLSNVLKERNISPERFILEITESTLAVSVKSALDVLTRLRLKGFSLSIDDFGTGHSSLARLHQIPFGELKIDKSFVGTADKDPESRIIVKNTIDLADSLGLVVVAEGAETENHIRLLSRFRCDQVQGYFYTKPLPGDEFMVWYTKWNAEKFPPGN